MSSCFLSIHRSSLCILVNSEYCQFFLILKSLRAPILEEYLQAATSESVFMKLRKSRDCS